MKKVLIIGSLGMLGQELVRVFGDDKNYEVFGWDKNDIDITDETQVRQKIGKLKPEIIINAAAYNAVDKCEEPEGFELATKLNGLAPGYLAQAAKGLNLSEDSSPSGSGAVFVHFSTDYVFDGSKKEGYLENDQPSPISKYGETKFTGERAIQKADGNYYIIRLQYLFGQSAKSVGAKKSFFETMLELSKTKRELEVVDEGLANFTYAPDLARQTKYIVENNLSFDIYHVTNEGAPVAFFGAAKILFELSGNKDIKLVPVSSDKFFRPARRPKYSILINTKLPALRPWPEALKEFLKSRKDR